MLNIKNYDNFCTHSDKLLGENPSISRVSIDFLHIIRPHHIYKKNFELFFSYSSILFYWHLLKKLIKSILIFLISFFKNLFNDKLSTLKYSKVDVIYVSHLFNLSQLKSKNDLYFNDLKNQLESQLINSKRIFINHSKNSGIQNARDIVIGKTSVINDITIRILQLREFTSLLYAVSKSKSNYEKRITFFASLESLSNSTFNNLRIYFFFKEILKIYSPKIVITTFEGHAYERIIYKIINSSSKIITAGYQHSAIFKHQHSIKRYFTNDYSPKLIFTSGKITNKFFSELNKQNKIIELGSSRGEIKIEQKKKVFNYLVVPEGIIEDVDVFLDFVSQITDRISDKKFLFRFHPSISINQIKERKLKYKDNPQIIFSDNSLKNDIEESMFVLYSGSTAVFSSVIGGLTPIYFDNYEIDLNPIYHLKESIQYVKDTEDFINIKEDSEAIKNIHSTYCKDYFTDYNISKIINLIR